MDSRTWGGGVAVSPRDAGAEGRRNHRASEHPGPRNWSFEP
jgi:hypothetical protein